VFYGRIVENRSDIVPGWLVFGVAAGLKEDSPKKAAMRDSAEQQLVEGIRAGDEGAIAQLSSFYGSRILHLAFRYTRNREDAEEVAQDVLLKVCRNIEGFRGDSALSSWIYRITFNTAMSRLRASRARSFEVPADARSASAPEAEQKNTLPRDVPDWSPLADDEIMRAQLRRRLVKALRQLPEIYRLPVLLRDVQGLSTEEASAVLRVKDQTLKSRLHRGRLILRDELAEFAGGLSLHRPAGTSRRAEVLH
jgi:RNA polymerase sigma-70 factor (ECF subfamily)